MNKYKLSIIIPCYSVGKKLLAEAIESIENQTYENWEIILVDDCSPEKEWDIELVNRLRKENKLTLIKNQKNLGLAISRNVGFDSCSGDIILFLDSDDKYKENNFFEFINEKFNEFSNLDVIQFGYEILIENQKNKREKEKLKVVYFEKIKIEDYLKKYQSVSVCWKAYKKSFLINNNIRHFNKNEPCEDWNFCFEIFIKNPNIYITNEKFYFYRQRKGSITDIIKKSKDKDFYSIKLIKKNIDEYININRGGVNSNLKIFENFFLSKPILILLLKYGYKKCQKKLEINKSDLKQMLNFQKKEGNWKVRTAIKLRFILKPIFKIFLK